MSAVAVGGRRLGQGAVGLLGEHAEARPRHVATADHGHVGPPVPVHVGQGHALALRVARMLRGSGECAAGELGEHQGDGAVARDDVPAPVAGDVGHLRLPLALGADDDGRREVAGAETLQEDQAGGGVRHEVELAVAVDIDGLDRLRSRQGDRLAIGQCAVALEEDVERMPVGHDGVGLAVPVEVAGGQSQVGHPAVLGLQHVDAVEPSVRPLGEEVDVVRLGQVVGVLGTDHDVVATVAGEVPDGDGLRAADVVVQVRGEDRGGGHGLRRPAGRERGGDEAEDGDGAQAAPAAEGHGQLPYQPATSAMTWAEPALLKRSTVPPAPTWTTTRFGTVWLGT